MRQASEQKKTTGAAQKAERQWFRSVGLRAVTAFVGMPIVLGVAWLGGWWAFVVAALIALLAISELHSMMVHEGYHPLVLVSCALSLLFMLAAMLPGQRVPMVEIGISVALLASFPFLFFRKKLEGAMLDWSLTLAIAFYVGWPLSLILVLRGFQVGLGTGLWWLFLLFGGVWGFDTGAFFAGHFWGRHKLAPRISPGKTWEGVFGGLLFSVSAALVFATLALGMPWYLAVPLGVLLGMAAMLGDLAESLIKRQTHVKDSGQFFPGHGGVLDRIDSVLFAILVIYIFALLVGKI